MNQRYLSNFPNETNGKHDSILPVKPSNETILKRKFYSVINISLCKDYSIFRTSHGRIWTVNQVFLWAGVDRNFVRTVQLMDRVRRWTVTLSQVMGVGGRPVCNPFETVPDLDAILESTYASRHKHATPWRCQQYITTHIGIYHLKLAS